MQIHTVPLTLLPDTNVIVGQAHFIKSAPDLSEIVVTTVPQARFGLAFCEASGPCLIRTEGNDPALVAAATEHAQRIGAGHVFVLLLRNAYPINVLPAIKQCQEVAQVFCATANPLQILVGETEQGRGVLGVVDGAPPQGVEADEDKHKRREFLRAIGYKA